MGVSRKVPQILTRFQTKKCNFPHPFSIQTRPLKSIPVFRPGLSLALAVRAQTKKYSNAFRIRIFLFLFYSFGIETLNTFIQSAADWKTIPDSRPKRATSIPVFRPKRRIPDGAVHTYMAYIREYPPWG